MTVSYSYGPGTYNPTQLQAEIVAAGGGPAAMLYISSDATIGATAANIAIVYTSALSGPDQTTLNAKVAAHVAALPPGAEFAVGTLFQFPTSGFSVSSMGMPTSYRSSGAVGPCGSSYPQLAGCLLSPGVNLGTNPQPIQAGGLATLTTSQWDAQTGQTGGLTAGAYYYTQSTGGLRTTPDSASFLSSPALVGLALSPTQLLLMVSPPNCNMPTAWVKGTVAGGTATATRSMGVNGVSRVAVGKVQVTWRAAFSSADYFVSCIAGSGGAGYFCCEDDSNPQTTTTCSFQFFNGAGTLSDPNKFYIFAYGG